MIASGPLSRLGDNAPRMCGSVSEKRAYGARFRPDSEARSQLLQGQRMMTDLP